MIDLRLLRRSIAALAAGLFLAAAPGAIAQSPAPTPPRPPNILLILADDLGYGDLGCYNPEAKVATPHLDRLAQSGIRFTDAHSPATVCTPTRYGVLTGRMPFRTGRYTVFTGVGGPCLIEEGRLTLPGMLRQRGYATGCVGKWHVGATFFDTEGRPLHQGGLEAVQRIDYARPLVGGPTHHGFDSFFGTVCCPTTDWLYAYVQDDRVPVPPTDLLDKGPLPVHPYSRDNRRGMVAPDFDLERVDLAFLERSQEFLRQHVATASNRPFFLYHATQAVHLPSFAAPEFAGKSGAGPHGDFLHQLDWIVGQLMATLDELGVADDTLVLFTSDNGPETTTTVHMREDQGHDPARPWRGMKRDMWEGGHRVPLIARWPGRIAAGSTTDQLASLTDLMATCATVAGATLPGDSAEDSFDLGPILHGTATDAPVRDFLLQQAFGRPLSLRQGRWKYLDHQGSAGNNYARSERLKAYALPDTAPDAPGQLYDLSADPGETRNLYFEHPEMVARLKARLDGFVDGGRSAPRAGAGSGGE